MEQVVLREYVQIAQAQSQDFHHLESSKVYETRKHTVFEYQNQADFSEYREYFLSLLALDIGLQQIEVIL